jgi:hypothetical protein
MVILSIFDPALTCLSLHVKTQHLRQDKTCLNCGHDVPDRFCGHCGQENVDTKESFGHLAGHFFQDITHYDSKLLLTLKYLFFYPGRVTKEYIAGKRQTFVNPIRLYVFTSFVFFLLAAVTGGNHHDPYARESQHDRSKQKAVFGGLIETAEDIRKDLDSGKIQPEDTAKAIADANALELIGQDSLVNAAHVYDSLQNTFSGEQRDNWVKRKTIIRFLQLRDKYGANVGYAIQDKFLLSYPKLFFLLLPFFALLLSWFFRRKDLVYGDHAIFSIHMHTVVFMLGILAMLIGIPFHGFGYYGWVVLLVFIYLVLSLRNTYQVSFGKAFVKSIGVIISYALGSAFVLLLFLFFILAIT